MSLIDDLIRDEGLRLKPYRDRVGRLTIGIGRNLDDVGITEAEARQLCDNDITVVISALLRHLPWTQNLDQPRFFALANMAFNMGIVRLGGFINMLRALEHGDWETAANEALASKWAEQVGDRAKRIAAVFRGESAAP